MSHDSFTSSRHERKKKIAGISSFILISMVIAVTVGVRSDIKVQSPPPSGVQDAEISSSKRAIKSICRPTDYKEVCEQSLAKTAGNTTDPRKLTKAGFHVAIKALKVAIRNTTELKNLEKDPMASQALGSCKQLLRTAVADLRDSFARVDSFELGWFNEYINNLKVWLSAAITYQATCLDGFENTTSQAGEQMREILLASSQLTSNGLAIVSGLASVMKDLGIQQNNRKLQETHQDGFPSWVDARRRTLLQETPETIKPDIIVALDGSGQYKSIAEAISHIPEHNRNGTFVLYIKEGVYKEQIAISRSMTHVMMIGDGAEKTKITGNLNYAAGVQTFKTATVSINGNYFMAKDIGFENSAGPKGYQAVALKVQSDMSIFYRCRMDGYQDTLYAHTYRQFYRDCTVTGTIDFIFGDAAAVFQNCQLVVRKPLEKQECVVTAQGRNETREPTGFVIQNCTITADKEYYPLRFKNPTFLGRPWRQYSRTLVMESQLDDLISPQGWFPWSGDFGLDSLFYSEHNNRGPGAVSTGRVVWKGIKNLTLQEIVGFTAGKFIMGDEWIPITGVPYNSGFTNVPALSVPIEA